MNGTVVIGGAVGLEPHEVTPLLASLRSCDYDGDVVLLVDRRLERRLRDEPLAAGARLVRVRSLMPLPFRRARRSRLLWNAWRPVQAAAWAVMKLSGRLPLPAKARQRAQAAIARAVCTPMEARFLHARRLLEQYAHDRAVLTDVRDVLFQRDPSADIPRDALGVSVETRRYTIGSERLNSMWVRDTFGADVLAEIGDSPVSCVGVTYGGGAAVSRYLDRMTTEILRLSSAAARRGGADTAIHNVLVWTGQLGDVQLLETLASAVATLNAIPAEEARVSDRGTLLNGDGSEPSIVHQYDRVPGLAPTLLQSLAAERRSGSYAPAR